MKYTYKETSIQKIYLRCLPKIKQMCNTISHQMGSYCYNLSPNNILQEATIKFWSEFDEYYNDKQYMNFLFIAIKTRVRSIQMKEANMRSKYMAPKVTNSDNIDGDPYMDGLNNFKDEKTNKPNLDSIEYIADNICIGTVMHNLHDALDQMIVMCVVSGKSMDDTCKEVSSYAKEQNIQFEDSVEIDVDRRLKTTIKNTLLEAIQ